MSSASTPLRDRLQDHYDELVSQLMPAYYINFLFAKRVLSPLDKDNLEGIKQQIAQAKCFVDILLKKDESSIKLFLDYLKTKRDGQPQLYRLLFPELYKGEEPYVYGEKLAPPMTRPVASKVNDGPNGRKTNESMGSEITSEQILKIAEIGASKWLEIGIFLGFKKEELDRYESKCRPDEYKLLREILFAWKERERHPTLDKVLEACRKARIGAAAERAIGI